MDIPRILLAAGASGSGKTLITCGLLQALVNRKMKVASFKCGPDYIDPMFHSRVIGTKSRNLDTFFTDAQTTRYLLGKNAADCDIAVMEGVMGYYDGVGGISTKASAYDLADTTDTPVILVVNSRGMSISVAAYIKGFMEYKDNSHVTSFGNLKVSIREFLTRNNAVVTALTIHLHAQRFHNRSYLPGPIPSVHFRNQFGHLVHISL